MKHVFIITALVLAFACTKKTDNAISEDSTTTTESTETVPGDNGSAQEGIAPGSVGTEAANAGKADAVRDSNKDLVKDKDGKIVREAQSSSSSN